VNQIGFDSYDLIAGTLAKTPPGPDGEVYTWAMVLGTTGLNGPLRWWAADPFEQAAAAGPP